MIKKILYKIAAIARKAGKNLSAKDRAWNKLLHDWTRLNANKKFRTNYPELNENAVVFDLGGYKGQWASDIFSQYLCNVHVFEPHPDFALAIKNRFSHNPKIKVYDYGLGAKDEQITLATSSDSTSTFIKGKEMVSARLKDINSFWKKGGFETIDLMKVNIEGGEFELLEHLIQTGLIVKVKNIQVQFHHFVPNAEKRMSAIQKELEKTHALTYRFKFFWENWAIKSKI